jgi:hypothetical protein
MEAACAKLEEVKRAAEQAAAADGLTAPSAELLLVDHAHIEVMKVRRELGALLDDWKTEQDHEADVQRREARLDKIRNRCGTAVGVIAFLTAAALQIPEVQHEVVQYAAELAQVIQQAVQHTAEAISAQVGALGVVAATSIASKPGEGFSLIGPEPSPNGPSPSRDPSSVIESVDSTPRSDSLAAQGEPAASTVDSRQERTDAFLAIPEGLVDLDTGIDPKEANDFLDQVARQSETRRTEESPGTISP